MNLCVLYLIDCKEEKKIVELDGEKNLDILTDINPSDMQKRRDAQKSKYIIFDVREKAELVDKFHFPNGDNDWINIPKKNILDSKDVESLKKVLLDNYKVDLSKYDEIYCTCKAGFRGQMVGNHLLKVGVNKLNKKIFNIVGGMLKYRNDVGLDKGTNNRKAL